MGILIMLRRELYLSSSSSSSEDSDSEIIHYIKRRRRKTNIRIDQFLVEDTEFLCRYRVTMATARFLVRCIQPRMQLRSCKNNALTLSEQLLLALRFYATCSIQQLVGDVNNIHQATVSRAIHKVSEALASLAPQYIYMPRTESEMAKVSYDFYSLAEFPRVIGAIDCTHVPIQSPGGEDAELYRCRKGFFSLNVQIIVDAQLKIRDIVCRWPGSAHDSTIFDQSQIKERIESGEFGNRFLLGDGGYSQMPYLMTPYRAPGNSAEELYNRSQIKTRNTVERSYGVWKRRFPCLGLKLRVRRDRMEAVIVATAVLYNICRNFNEPEVGDCLPMEEVMDGPTYSQDTVLSTSGKVARNNLVRDFFS